MKYLYSIFRLFKCPHKYKVYFQEQVSLKHGPIGKFIILQCSKCGRMESETHII